MEDISHLRDCYGCGVYAIIYPHQIIGMELDKNGFYQPKIVNCNKCSHCGLCLFVCDFSHNKLALEKVSELDGYAS